MYVCMHNIIIIVSSMMTTLFDPMYTIYDGHR